MDVLLGLLALAFVAAPFVGIALSLGQRARLKRLEDELADLRRRLADDAPSAASDEAADAPAPQPARPRPTPPTPAPAAAATTSAAPAKRDSAALESFLGGRVLLVVGVVAVLFAVGFFLKVAFERGWFPPEARVLASVVAGVAALVGGDRLRARGLTAYGHAIMGGGLGALFLAVFYAAAGHELIGRPAGFAATAAVTWMGATLAVRRDAPLLAWLGFVGAFVAPALLGRDEDSLEALTAWLAFVDVGVAWVLVRRAWPGLDALAVVSTCSYFALWLERWADDERRVVGASCLAALTVATLVVCHGPAVVARRAPSVVTLLAALFATLFAALAGHELLAAHDRVALGLGLLGLAALHGAAGLLVARRSPDAAPSARADGEVLACYALATAATAAPYLFDAHGLSIAWAAVGGAAISAGARRGAPWFAGLGGAALVTAVAQLLRDPWAAPVDARPFLHVDFVTWLAPPVAMAGAAWAVTTWRPAWDGAARVLRIGGALLAALALGLETQRVVAGVGPPTPPDALQAAQATAAAVVAGFALLVAVVTRRVARHAGPAAAGAGAVALLWFGMALSHGTRFGVEPFVNLHVAASLAALVGLGFVSSASAGIQRVLVGAATLAAWLALASIELYEWGEVADATDASRASLRFRAQVWTSIVWGSTGAVPLVVGFLLDRAALRWTGLVVLAFTIAKVFLFDLSRLDTMSRIGSFLALGLLLVGASFLYQRARVRA